MGLGSLLGGFAQGFGNAALQIKNQQRQDEQVAREQEMLKLKTNAFKNQEEIAMRQRKAKTELLQMMASGKGLSDVLTNPQGQGLLIESGIDPMSVYKQIRLADQQKGLSDVLAALEGRSGAAAPGGTAGAGAPGTAPTGGAKGLGGGGYIDPLSIMQARITGDVGALKPAKMNTETINTPQGPQIVSFPDFDPSKKTVVGSPVVPSEVTIEQKLRPATRIVNDLDSVVNRVFKKGDFWDRASQSFGMNAQRLTRDNPDMVFLLDFESKLAPLVKALGEAGALTDHDIKRAEKSIPKIFPVPDSLEIAQQKVKELRGIIESSMQRMGGGSGGAQGQSIDDELEALRGRAGLK